MKPLHIIGKIYFSVIGVFSLLLVTSCGSGGGGSSMGTASPVAMNAVNAPASFYLQTNLVSSVPGLAQRTDPTLVNAWGIVHPPTGPWWVNANGSGIAFLFDSQGNPFPATAPLVVTIPTASGSGSSSPTGVVFNATTDFAVATAAPARFIFVTEDGTIAGWNSGVNPTTAVLKVNNGPAAVYKGAALADNDGVNYLYVANFRGASVDVFDTNFMPVPTVTGAFSDSRIPAGFAPFNIANINGSLVVTYAKQDDAKHDDVAGPGNGFADIYTPSGTLVRRLEHGDWLNSPWGVALAPAGFGKFSNHLLVGNFGSGQIAAFETGEGEFEALLKGVDNTPLTISGLWGLGFGNDATAGPATTLFFAAGINHENDGLFGTITAQGPVVNPVEK